jgi:hypothetical protein
MTDHNNPGPGLVSIHVGYPDPAQHVEAPSSTRRRLGRQRPRPTITDSSLDWHARGATPAWLGTDTAHCAAAFEPSLFAGQGADELKRFLTAAAQRGELALVVATMGDAQDDTLRSPLTTVDASVTLPDLTTVIHGVRLPVGARPSLASDLSNADRDLACRLLDRPADAPWWALRLDAVHWERLDDFGSPSPPVTPAGTLQAILVDSLGDPVVAAWINPDGDQRWYIIPDHSDWGQVIDWVVRQALPAYAPDALRRVRSPLFHDPVLMTIAEVDAQQALADMEVRHAQERAELQAQLQYARDNAETVREALLHGTGSGLVNAVRAVLTSAGFHTVDLDHELGGSKSADLLATRDNSCILIEVKSTTGRAPESLTTICNVTATPGRASDRMNRFTEPPWS